MEHVADFINQIIIPALSAVLCILRLIRLLRGR